MAWVRLDDEFPDHPKIAVLSNDAFCLHVTAMCWVANRQTDGRLPSGVLKRLAWRCQDPDSAAAELEAAGAWDKTPDGWEIHDFLQYNPSREQLTELSDKRRNAGKAGAMARWQSHSKPHSKPHGKPHGKSHGKPDGKPDGKTMPDADAETADAAESGHLAWVSHSESDNSMAKSQNDGKSHGKSHGKPDGKTMPHTPSPIRREREGDRPPAVAPVSIFPDTDPEWGVAISKLEQFGMLSGQTLVELGALWPDLANGRRGWIDDACNVARASGASSPAYAVRVLANAVKAGRAPGQSAQRSNSGKAPERNIKKLLGLEDDD